MYLYGYGYLYGPWGTMLSKWFPTRNVLWFLRNICCVLHTDFPYGTAGPGNNMIDLSTHGPWEHPYGIGDIPSIKCLKF